MVLWVLVGLIVWALCVLLALAIFKGGHRIRGNGYEQKVYLGSANTQDVEGPTTKTKRDQCLHAIAYK